MKKIVLLLILAISTCLLYACASGNTNAPVESVATDISKKEEPKEDDSWKQIYIEYLNSLANGNELAENYNYYLI